MKKWKPLFSKRVQQLQKRFGFVLFAAILAIVTYAATFTNIQPEKLDVSLFSVAPKDIYSPVTTEDEEATEAKVEEALSKVENQYTLKRDYAQNQVDTLSKLFQAIENERTAAKEAQEAAEDEASKKDNPDHQKEDKAEATAEEAVTVKDVKDQLSPDVYGEFSQETIKGLLDTTPEQLEIARDASITSVHRVMEQRIAVENLEERKEEVRREISYTSLPQALKQTVSDLAAGMIIPNYVYDPQETSKQRQEIRDDIEPVMIQMGQLIVKEGQLIDREIYRMLELVGVLDQSTNLLPFIGLALLTVLLAVLIVYYAKDLKDATRSVQVYQYIYLIIFSVVLLMMKIISFIQPENQDQLGLLVPVAAGTMLIKLLINNRMAVITSIALAFTGSLIFSGSVPGNFNYDLFLYYLASGLAGTLFLSKRNQRSQILQAGLIVAFINAVVVTALTFVGYDQVSDLLLGVGLAIISGVASSILTLGLLPFFEAGFGVLSTIKLIELSSPNHPLLRKILVETPGTYHHSVMVANLSEAACEAVGANGLLARVGSYYHDIGKTKRPHFFIENQMGMENPHNKIAPQLSKTIITAHATDGAEMLRSHKMPKEIVDIAAQHHGTTLLKYFYHQANEQADKEISEAEFRYIGPKAQTKEVAIIGICDSVEAAVRSLSKPNPNKIETIVRSIISDRLQDGQFDECDLTLKELDQVARSICETLKGIFHSRIEYPDMAKKKVK
ncbi:HD family phosphohydrolase [Bacillaceae bacterium SIJ1]|uniref:HD family phosphohydrolase n=1 Tax=Litoribacterium kuwaitense TaxID=1398745 RepID=UPI0013EDA46B|nr:HD family phosphohydrolase [Litoribacterium kuwaitense]NGP43521.1 HD family phosphohydrolase [Litoribacterium kuwaitense]